MNIKGLEKMMSEDGTYVMVNDEKLQKLVKLAKIHKIYHLAMRQFLNENNLTDEFYKTFKYGDIVEKEYDSIVNGDV